MTWVNTPWVGELVVQEYGDHLIRFTDTKTNEAVQVFVPEDLNGIMMTVLDDAGATTTPEPVAGITNDVAQHFVKGEGVAERDVWHYVSDKHCARLRAGLTVHRSMASSTPHPFERTPEPGFEEVFWFILPQSGKAVLEGEGMRPDGHLVDAVWPVRDRSLAQVPMGWHRVVSLPEEDGTFPQVAYVWCYLCKEERWEKDR